MYQTVAEEFLHLLVIFLTVQYFATEVSKRGAEKLPEFQISLLEHGFQKGKVMI